MEVRTYTITVEPLEDGGYSVTVPALPGCLTWGKTFKEAVEMAKDAIQGYLEALLKRGQPIPAESEPTAVLGISVRVPARA